MFRIPIICSFLILSLANVMAQSQLVAFEDIKALQIKEPRPVAVLIMTTWCKYCHAMKNTMLKNKKVSALLGAKFYTVFLDAEQKDDILFAGRRFKHKEGVHELAQELATMNGEVSYPSFCLLNSRNEIIYQHDGFLSSQAMVNILLIISKSDN